MATMLAILLESSLIAGLAWYAQHPSAPLPKPHPLVQPIQVFMAAVVPASTPPTAASAVLPKPIPAPVLNPTPVQPEFDTGIKPVVESDEQAEPQSLPKLPIRKPAPPTPMQAAHSKPRLESESKPQSTPKSLRKAGDRQEVPKAHRHEPQAAHSPRKPVHGPVRQARPSPVSAAASSASVAPPSSLKAEENPSAIPSRAMPSNPPAAIPPAPIPPAPIPPAPIPPADLGDLIRTFGGRLSRAVQDNLRYPPAAQAMGQAGRTLVAFTIEAGQIRDVRVKRSSGSALLDAAAIRAVQTLACPPLPGPLADRTLPFTLWVRFDSD
ncbi:hypothetical protein A9404_00625 [Halothiobacillus diazotrophicus]|uniref:TonB C-terminal domain-containing protein n=1 Tax=Halothiobacillus diazotrophicus TaxID=1860122 RepID=A0A191ZDZ0_9GAMM|nr:energy transducer TonB [Halothiobacillus diazotrophicus]ANJ66082.1 hypothetical protein A9404_00625 [Halothiobacillus diazotrophicus]